MRSTEWSMYVMFVQFDYISLLWPYHIHFSLSVCFPGRSSFLTHPDLTHEGLVKVIGYCYEGKTKSIIYDVNTLDTLEHYILRGMCT